MPRTAISVFLARTKWLVHPATVTGLLLVALWTYKARDLTLPYFWDELGVYGRAAVYMYDHGLGLLPSALPPELSRGHPLLLAFMFGAAFRIFGASVVVAHVLMLAISSGLMLSVYWIARARWNAWVGVAAAGLMLVQPLFLAQSTLVLPEIPMALACLWAMHAFASRKYALAGISLGLAIFIKETAIVLDFVLGVILFVPWLHARRARANWLRPVMALAIPAALYGGFLLIQKHQNGWFLFPFHSGQVNFHWSAMKGSLLEATRFAFAEQGRIALSVIVLLWLSSGILGHSHEPSGEPRGNTTVVYLTFVAAFITFSAGNVFMKRYLLCLLPPLVILAAGATFELVRSHVRPLLASSAALGILCLSELQAPQFNCAYDMSFRESVLLQQQATCYLEDRLGAEKHILANFPTVFGLEDPRYGYSSRTFAHSSYVPSSDDEYIFASELSGRFEPPAGVHTELVKRFSSPYMNIALYRILPRSL